MTTARVPAGVSTGGQFATGARTESPAVLCAPGPVLTGDVDPVEGNCWSVPDDVDTAVAAEADVQLSSIAWWSTRPGLDSWCSCGTCPTEPRELPEGTETFDLTCDGALVAHYAARMAAGDEFPPVQVLHDPAGQPWGGPLHRVLVDDGFHRISAALLLGRERISAHVFAADHAAALAALEPAPVDLPPGRLRAETFLPDGVDHLHHAPFMEGPVYPALDETTWAGHPVRDVPLAGLHRTQRHLGRGHVQRHLAGGEPDGGDEAWVVVHRGVSWVVDGHHRAVAEKVAGRTTMRAHVFVADW